jgi:hypothetical protein
MSRDYPTNSDDVIDVRDVINRVEELRDERKPKIIVGFNLPGYLPDSEPHTYFGWDDARNALADILEEHANSEEEELFYSRDRGELSSQEISKRQGIVEELHEQAKDVRAGSDRFDGDYGRTIGKYHYFMEDTLEEGIDDEDEDKELKDLESLLESLKGYGGDHQWEGDWYPVTLVRDSHFTEYAQQLAEDIGAINSEAGWPNNCIDWERAARELRIDYSTVDFDGETYWYR